VRARDRPGPSPWDLSASHNSQKLKPDGENQSIGCSNRAPNGRAGPRCSCCLGHRLVPRRSLQRLIGDFVAKIILFVGLADCFVIHDTEIPSSAPPPLAFNRSTSEAERSSPPASA
jgi:hypothetical protein